MKIAWDHVVEDAAHPHDHLVALNDTGYVTLRLRTDEDGNWICAFTAALLGKKWTLPQVEDWMRRVAERIDEESVSGRG